MLRKPNRLLALALLCSIGQAGVSLADSPPFIGRLPQGTVEPIGVTNCPPTKQSRWWQPDGSASQMDSLLPKTNFTWLQVRIHKGEKGAHVSLPPRQLASRLIVGLGNQSHAV